MQSARLTATSAWFASWAACLPTVLEDLGFPDGAALAQAVPGLAAALADTREELRQAGASPPDLLAPAVAATRCSQRELARQCQARASNNFLHSQDSAARALLRSGGGPGAAAWLQAPSEPKEALDDQSWQCAFQLRAGLPVCEPGQTCRHKRADGQLCGAPLDQYGAHAMQCSCGGGLVRRHNLLRDYLAEELEDRLGCLPQ